MRWFRQWRARRQLEKLIARNKAQQSSHSIAARKGWATRRAG